MANVKLAAKFTKADQPKNGFTDEKLVGEVLAEHGGEGYAIVRWSARRITEELEDGTRVPTFAFVALEPVFDDDLATVKAVYDKQYEHRTGQRPDALEQTPLFNVDADGERVVPEPSAEELMAERAEAKAQQDGNA